MSGSRSKRTAATAAESRISKFVEEEKTFERNSRSKKSKFDFDELDRDYNDDASSGTSSDESDSQSLLTQKHRARGKKLEKSTEKDKSPLWYRNFKRKMEQEKQN